MFSLKVVINSLMLVLVCILLATESEGAVLSRYGKRQWDGGLPEEIPFTVFGNQNVICRSVGFGDLYKCHMAGSDLA